MGERDERTNKEISKNYFSDWHICDIRVTIFGGRYKGKKNLEANIAAEQQDVFEEMASFQNTIDYHGTTYQYRKDIVNILCIGVDKEEAMWERDDDGGSVGQADAVFLVSLDFEHSNIRILAIPRDTMVSIVACDENGNEMIYARGKNGVITNKEVEQAMMFYTTFGMNQEDARKQAVLYVEEREALYQQAIEAGYTVTDQEVYDYLEKLKVFIEQSDNKEDAMAIIEQFDSEEDYWNYEFEVYKKDLPIQKYMAAKEKEFKEVAPQAKSINEIEEEWQDYYEQIKAQAVENEEFKVVD